MGVPGCGRRPESVGESEVGLGDWGNWHKREKKKKSEGRGNKGSKPGREATFSKV